MLYLNNIGRGWWAMLLNQINPVGVELLFHANQGRGRRLLKFAYLVHPTKSDVTSGLNCATQLLPQSEKIAFRLGKLLVYLQTIRFVSFPWLDNNLATSFSVKLRIRDFIWPEDAANFSETPIVEGLKFTHVRLYDTPALRFIQQNGFHFALIQSELGLKTVLIWLLKGMKSGKCIVSFPSLALMSFCAPLSLLRRLPRYVKSSTNSSGSPLPVIGAVGVALAHIIWVLVVFILRLLL